MSRLFVALAVLAVVAAPSTSALSLGTSLGLGSGEDGVGIDLSLDLGADSAGDGAGGGDSAGDGLLGLDVGLDASVSAGEDLVAADASVSTAGDNLIDASADLAGVEADAAVAVSTGDTLVAANASVSAGYAAVAADASVAAGDTLLAADASVSAGDAVVAANTAISAGDTLVAADAGIGLESDGPLASLDVQAGTNTSISLAVGDDLAGVALDAPCALGCADQPDTALATGTISQPRPRTGASEPGAAESPWRDVVVEPLQEPAVQATLSASALAATAWATVRRHYLIRKLAKLVTMLPLGAGLFSRIQGDRVLDHPVRSAVREYVEANPGATMQEIRGAVDVAWGTVVHHLRRLEAEEHLVSQREGNHRRFFVRNTMSRAQRDDLATLAADNARQLALAVALRPGLRQKDLCDQVGVSNPVASKYLKRLEEGGLVRSMAQSRSRLYWPTERLEQTIPLLDGPHQEPVLSSRADLVSVHGPDHKSGARDGAFVATRA